MKRFITVTIAMFIVLSLSVSAFALLEFDYYDEPVKVSFMGVDGSAVPYDSTIHDRRSATENVYIDGYKEYMNVEVERIVPEDGAALSALVNTGMASGTLPDFIHVDRNLFFILAENDMLLDLTDAYEECGHKEIMQYIVESFPDRIASGYYNGQWLGIPVGQFYADAEVLWVRTDWLDKVGMEVPTTIDEVIETAYAFKEAGLGGENGVALGMTGYEGSPIYGDMTSFAAAYGIVLNTWNEDADGKYVYADTTDELKEVLLTLQELYSDGVIKSDFAVTNILTEEISNGACGMFFGPEWFGVTCIQTCYNTDPEAEWTCVLLPSKTGERVQQFTKALPAGFLVATKNCEHPEILFSLAEFGMEMRYQSSPEENARFAVCDDGYQMHNLSVTRAMIRPDEGYAKLLVLRDGFANNAEEVDAIANSDYQNIKAAMEGDRAHQGRYLTWMVARAGIYDLGNEHPELFRIAYEGPTTETMSLYLSSINAALASSMMEVVMGADISVYEEAVAQWYANGGQTITDEVNEYYSNK